MLFIESFAHRARLAEIVSRWIVDRPEPGDVALLKQIVNFNSYAATLWVDWFATDLLTRLHGVPPESFVASTKGALKDFIVEHAPVSSPRAAELIARYRRFPEDFYRETPFGGRVYSIDKSDASMFVASTRLKRLRRIAEKGARRIIDFMFTRIRDSADALAEERARQLGIPHEALITPPEQMVEEFRHAERRVLKAIRRGTIRVELPVMAIPDVAGVKVISEPSGLERVLTELASTPGARMVEAEQHRGTYSGTNVRLAVPLPRDKLRAFPPAGHALETFVQRGFHPRAVVPAYHQFLESAEDDVRFEVIISSYENLLESEIGASMHEERVLAQRDNPDYRGHLATNIRYLMAYMLELCLAPSNEDVTDVPIKLWVHYMPDYADALHRKLFCDQADDTFAARMVHNDRPGGVAASPD